MEEEHGFNNWDLYAVVRLGCRRRLSPPPLQVNDPFASLPPAPPLLAPPAALNPAPELTNKADAGWSFPDLLLGGGQDGNELLRALLASQPAVPSPLPTLLPPPPPPKQQQQQPVVVVPADVPAQARAAPVSAPSRAQPSGRQIPGAVPRSKRR
jgi:WRKY transcription factor 22